MKLITKLIGFLVPGFGKGGTTLWTIIGALTHGSLKALLEAKNEPRKVRFYSTSPDRRDDILKHAARLRGSKETKGSSSS